MDSENAPGPVLDPFGLATSHRARCRLYLCHPFTSLYSFKISVARDCATLLPTSSPSTKPGGNLSVTAPSLPRRVLSSKPRVAVFRPEGGGVGSGSDSLLSVSSSSLKPGGNPNVAWLKVPVPVPRSVSVTRSRFGVPPSALRDAFAPPRVRRRMSNQDLFPATQRFLLRGEPVREAQLFLPRNISASAPPSADRGGGGDGTGARRCTKSSRISGGFRARRLGQVLRYSPLVQRP